MIHQLENVLNEDDVVESLKVHLGLETALATRTGLAIAGPTMVANFAEWLKDESSASWYRDIIPTVRPNSLSDLHLVSKGTDYHHLGERSLAAALGARSRDIVGQVAKRAEISEAAAHGLLAVATWVLIVGISGENVGTTRKETAYVLASERQGLVDLGWGPWFDLVTVSPESYPPADFDRSAMTSRAPSSESRTPPVSTRSISAPAISAPAISAPAISAPAISAPAISAPVGPTGSQRDQLVTGIDEPSRPSKRIGLYVVGVVVALLAVTLLSGAFASEAQLFLNVARFGPELASQSAKCAVCWI